MDVNSKHSIKLYEISPLADGDRQLPLGCHLSGCCDSIKFKEIDHKILVLFRNGRSPSIFGDFSRHWLGKWSPASKCGIPLDADVRKSVD